MHRRFTGSGGSLNHYSSTSMPTAHRMSAGGRFPEAWITMTSKRCRSRNCDELCNMHPRTRYERTLRESRGNGGSFLATKYQVDVFRPHNTGATDQRYRTSNDSIMSSSYKRKPFPHFIMTSIAKNYCILSVLSTNVKYLIDNGSVILR